MGIMEKKMETMIMGYLVILGTILGLYRDNVKENGNYYSIYGLYKDDGKENRNSVVIGVSLQLLATRSPCM